MTGTKSRKQTKTPEQRQAEAEALHESIATQVEALADSEQWARFLAFAGAFHAYSLGNLLLILSQRPDATHVAGFRKWQSLGRQVRKGEKAVKIFGYRERKLTEDELDEETRKLDPSKQVVRYFPILSVFDIAQTDLMDGAEDPTELAAALTGDDDHGIIEALSAYLTGEGWTVEREALRGGKNGYSDPETRRVVIGEHLSPEHSAKTLIHEAAHVLMGHTDDLAEYAEHRGLMETEAESVAYVVAGLVGFDTSAYSVGYVAGWSAADAELIRSTAARVLTTVHRIAAVLIPTDDATNE